MKLATHGCVNYATNLFSARCIFATFAGYWTRHCASAGSKHAGSTATDDAKPLGADAELQRRSIEPAQHSACSTRVSSGEKATSPCRQMTATFACLAVIDGV